MTAHRITIAGEIWQAACPDRWDDRLEASFSHLTVPAGGRPVVTVQCDAGETHSGILAETFGQHPPPKDDRILAWRDSGVIVHLSRIALDRYDTEALSGLSLLHAARFEASYLGTNLFLRHIAWRARQRCLVPLHAGAIVTNDGAWLIPAGSGRGKSTLVAAALASGLDVLGDDFVLVDVDKGVVHSLYATIRLTPQGFALVEHHFGAGCLAQVGERPDEKLILTAVPGSGGGRFRQSAKLKGILLPERGETAEFGPPATASQAMSAFSSTFLLLPSLGYDAGFAFSRLSRLARKTPVRAFTVSTDLAETVSHLGDADG